MIVKPVLKYPGNKYRLLPTLLPLIDKYTEEGYDTFVDPFCGSGSVFLNVSDNFKQIYVNDINHDIIALFKYIKEEYQKFLDDSLRLFREYNSNTAKFYQQIRGEFNEMRSRATKRFDVDTPLSDFDKLRAVYYMYLNRHGFNGLSRYNREGVFNVAFGKYDSIYYPREELDVLVRRLERVTLTSVSFEDVFTIVDKPAVFYLDPPYSPLPDQRTNFTKYVTDRYDRTQEEKLIELVRTHPESKFILSNHDTPYTRELYHDAKLLEVSALRSISCKKERRGRVQELIAIYE